MAEKLNKKDLMQLFIRSNACQSAFNFERQQAMGFVWAMIPIINKLYSEEEDRIAGYKRHLTYYNSHPWTCGPIYGIVASMEEQLASGTEDVTEESIMAVKGALMGPLAGIGDSLLWGTLRPILAGVCASLALNGTGIAPLIFAVVLNVIHFGLMYYGVNFGYKFADEFMDKMEGMQIKVWMEAATILGLLVVGGLSATWLNVTTKLTYTVGDAMVALQPTLDKILPKLLSLVCTLSVFGLLRKGKSTTWVMVALVIVGLVFGFLGIM